MDGIDGLLANYGVRPQGKAAPMAASRSTGSAAWASSPAPRSTPSYDDLFSTPASTTTTTTTTSPSIDSLFDSFKATSSSAASSAGKAKPAYDDDDIFGAVPGLRPTNSTSSSTRYDGGDVFGAAPAYDDVFASRHRSAAAAPSYDDLLGGFGGGKPQVERKGSGVAVEEGDDDLLGVFGGRKPEEGRKKPAAAAVEEDGFGDGLFSGFAAPPSRKTNEDNIKKPAVPTSRPTASMEDDPFVVLGTTSSSGSTYPSPGRFTDPLGDLDKSANSKGKNIDSTTDNYGLFEDSSAFDQVPKSDPLFTSEINGDHKNMQPPSKARDSSPPQSSVNRNPARRSMEDLGNAMPKSHSSRYSDVYVDGSVPSSERYNSNGVEDQSPRSSESEDDIWLTVSEIPLFTQPTSAPPPSRSPPLLKQKPPREKANGKDNEFVPRSSQNRSSNKDFPDQAEASSLDDFEGFAKDKHQMPSHDNNLFDDDEGSDRNSSEDREEKDRQDKLEQEREMRLREEMKREQRRLEKERELQQQRERERQAVERATKEARERAGAEARAKAEREACQRVQRAAVQRAQQEARERAAAGAKEKAARAAAEARERAASEAKEKERAAAERTAAERVQQDARKRAERAAAERAAAEARERQAAAAARKKPSTADDLESFFGVDAQTSSVPKQRTPTVDSMFDSQPQSRATVNGSQRTASSSASVRKTPSATNVGFGDDLTDLFGAPAPSGVFQEVEGESEERRRARLERHQRTNDRAAKALAEKNERDMQVQREQAERDRMADTLDFEVRRWAAGKEGNLRALLSTLQYILWPECGWQALSLTDLITGAAVKKHYRKATLCIHPDKVQQKGATLKQKYIAEKVFDILKEAWNKFNSEELF